MVLGQFQETARFRKWLLVAASVMANHIHPVVGVPGDPEPSDLMRGLKSYGSRSLNARSPKPMSGTWWTQSGSQRKLADESAVFAAVEYLRQQQFPLHIWINPIVDTWKNSGERQLGRSLGIEQLRHIVDTWKNSGERQGVSRPSEPPRPSGELDPPNHPPIGQLTTDNEEPTTDSEG